MDKHTDTPGDQPVGRVSADDLALAATWLREYNDGETTTPSGESDETALTMFRVARWLEAEVQRRAEDAAVRAVQRAVFERSGKRVSAHAARRVVRAQMAAGRSGHPAPTEPPSGE